MPEMFETPAEARKAAAEHERRNPYHKAKILNTLGGSRVDCDSCDAFDADEETP